MDTRHPSRSSALRRRPVCACSVSSVGPTSSTETSEKLADRGCFLVAELQVVEAAVESAGPEQLVMGAALDHAAGIEHHDLVGVAHGGEPVRDHQHGAVGA